MHNKANSVGNFATAPLRFAAAKSQVLEDNQIIADIGYNGKVTLPGDKFYTAENVFQEFELYKL